jgi:membrane protein YdbS with pleckstrin-like domain
MEKSLTCSTGSWPIASILTIVFVILKLSSVIDWSWWWVLSPLWIGAAFTAVMLFIVFLIILIVTMFTYDK